MTRSNKPLSPNDPYNRHGTRHKTPDRKSGSKITGITLAALAAAAVAAAGLYLIDVDQTQEARLPNVDLQVTDGQMPKFDAELADVNVSERKVDVEVPSVDIETEIKTIEVKVPVGVKTNTETESVTVPTINIERPEEDDPADNPTD